MFLLLLYFFMGLGLSMDAFSLAIVYGTTNLKKNKCLFLSIIVGIFHFVMPNLGAILSEKFLESFITYGNVITGIVFLILALEMFLSLKDNEIKFELTGYLEMLLFALAVSIDSFSVGMALGLEKQNLITAGIVFSVVSAIFTFSGLILGKKLSKKVGSTSKIIGIIILFIFAGKYLLNI